MLKKTEKMVSGKTEKGKKWIEKNKVAIGFGLGMAAMTGIYMLAKKLDEPKSGCITFTKCLETGAMPNMGVNVYYKNRFGKEKNPLNIRYDYKSPTLKELCDALNEVVYPGN